MAHGVVQSAAIKCNIHLLQSMLFRYQKEEIELQIVPTATISEANLGRLTELPQILAKVGVGKSSSQTYSLSSHE